MMTCDQTQGYFRGAGRWCSLTVAFTVAVFAGPSAQAASGGESHPEQRAQREQVDSVPGSDLPIAPRSNPADRVKARVLLSLSGVALVAAITGRTLASWAWQRCELADVDVSHKGCAFEGGVRKTEGPVFGPQSGTFYVGGMAMIGGTAGTILFGNFGGKHLGREHAGASLGRIDQATSKRLLGTGVGLVLGGVASVGISAISLGVCEDEPSQLTRCRIPLGVVGFSLGAAALAVGVPMLSYRRHRSRAEQRARLDSISALYRASGRRALVGVGARWSI